MPLRRRTLIAGAAGLPLVNIGGARAAESSLKVAMNLPAGHPMNVRASEACARVAAATGGRVEMQTYPGSQLGADTAALAKLRTGELEFFLLSGSILSSVIPVASINNMGFVFKGYRQVWAAMDGRLGAYLSREIAKFGILTVGRSWNNGFRQITNSLRPITSAEDLRGLKLRVPVSPLWLSMFGALGATPASMNLSEAYAAMQAHAVDGQENPLALIQATKFYEVQQYCSLTYHMWDGYWLLANEGVFRGLDARTQEVITREFDRAAQDERDDLAKLDPHLRGDLAATGMRLNSVETASFQQALQQAGFYAEWRGKYGEAAWNALEEYSGPLA